MEWTQNNFKISDDSSLLNMTAIHDYLSNQSYWAKNISAARVKAACENSLCFGLYDVNDQIGLARVITDYATFAYLCDVYVLPAYQGKGLGKWLMSCVMGHPELQELRRWILATKDAHGLYKHSGFGPLTNHDRHMEYRNSKVFDGEWLIE